MPIPSQTKVIPSRRSVRSDFSVIRAPKDEEGPTEISVLAHVHSYPPFGLAGAPLTLHWFLKHGVNRGWTPRVVVNEKAPRADTFDGIPVRNDYNVRTVSLDYNFSQVIITHLNTTPKAIEMSRRAGRPLVHLVHSERQLDRFKVTRRDCALAVFNSEAVMAAVGWEGPSVVARPHVPVAEYATTNSGDAVTLINLSHSKGAEMFYALARQNPGVRFIGVTGSYGTQVVAPELSNLEIWEPQVDMRKVYEQTHLLLMPSDRETWGRTAIEAACSGIPSICSSTPGMLETDIAEMYLDLDFEKWNKAVRRYTRGEKAWAEASQKALTKAVEWDEIVTHELDLACARIEALV